MTIVQYIYLHERAGNHTGLTTGISPFRATYQRLELNYSRCIYFNEAKAEKDCDLI